MFLLYRVENRSFIQERENLRLTGHAGPIGKAAAIAATSPTQDWELDEFALLQGYGGTPDTQAVIIDMYPGDPDSLHLYRLRHVWGRLSQNELRTFCPVAIELEALYVEEPPPSGLTVAEAKAKFPFRVGDEELYEFQYLKRSKNGGTYVWGRTGYVNSVLLWPDVLNSFICRINGRRSSRGLDRIPHEFPYKP